MGIFHGVCAGTLISMKKISRQKKKRRRRSMAYFLLCRPHVLRGKSSLSAADKIER
jgi:hypothetical protein